MLNLLEIYYLLFKENIPNSAGELCYTLLRTHLWSLSFFLFLLSQIIPNCNSMENRIMLFCDDGDDASFPKTDLYILSSLISSKEKTQH